MQATRAIVRGISDSFSQALVQTPAASPIDLSLARRQHAAYVAALRGAGVAVTELEPDPAFPDGCFVEDCAIVAGGQALITRPGAPSRRGEVEAVAACLGRLLPVSRILPPATLDGGDCLRMGKTWFVGRSQRTNAEGAHEVARIFAPLGYQVIEVEVSNALHLKCVCSAIDERRLLLARGAVPPARFEGYEILEVPIEEAYAANIVSINGTVLVAEGYPETKRVIAATGLRVVGLDVSEISKADGSLTCLSILF